MLQIALVGVSTRLRLVLNVNRASTLGGLGIDADGPVNPFATGAALKLEVSKTAEIDSRATQRATRSAEAQVELFCCFFIELFRLNCINCNPVSRGTKESSSQGAFEQAPHFG